MQTRDRLAPLTLLLRLRRLLLRRGHERDRDMRVAALAPARLRLLFNHLHMRSCSSLQLRRVPVHRQ